MKVAMMLLLVAVGLASAASLDTAEEADTQLGFINFDEDFAEDLMPNWISKLVEKAKELLEKAKQNGGRLPASLHPAGRTLLKVLEGAERFVPSGATKIALKATILALRFALRDAVNVESEVGVKVLPEIIQRVVNDANEIVGKLAAMKGTTKVQNEQIKAILNQILAGLEQAKNRFPEGSDARNKIEEAIKRVKGLLEKIGGLSDEVEETEGFINFAEDVDFMPGFIRTLLDKVCDLLAKIPNGGRIPENLQTPARILLSALEKAESVMPSGATKIALKAAILALKAGLRDAAIAGIDAGIKSLPKPIQDIVDKAKAIIEKIAAIKGALPDKAKVIAGLKQIRAVLGVIRSRVPEGSQAAKVLDQVIARFDEVLKRIGGASDEIEEQAAVNPAEIIARIRALIEQALKAIRDGVKDGVKIPDAVRKQLESVRDKLVALRNQIPAGVPIPPQILAALDNIIARLNAILGNGKSDEMNVPYLPDFCNKN